MNTLVPSSKGWVRKYFSIMKNYESFIQQMADVPMDPEEIIYSYIQPTGVMYGYPIGLLFLPENEESNFTAQDKFKLLLLEGLMLMDHINHGQFNYHSLEESLENFVKFYEGSEIQLAKKGWFDFKGLDTFQKIESIINNRVDIKTSFSHKLWTSYLYNSLIFTDLLLYYEYSQGIDAESLKSKRLDIMLDVIKVIALAAHADGELQDEEQAIFDVFMASANLDEEHFAMAEDFWKGGKTLNDLNFNYSLSWLLKRYFIEIAVLTVWSDLHVSENEQEFLDALSDKLNVHIEEKDKSFIAIQTFVLENHKSIPFFKGNNDVELLMNGATERWRNIILRNRDKIATELKESKELVSLIKKSRSEELSKEEKEKVKTQFKDLARTIPSLTLFLLPGGSLLLPIVLKLIPDLIPTAFRSNQLDEEETPKIDE